MLVGAAMYAIVTGLVYFVQFTLVAPVIAASETPGMARVFSANSRVEKGGILRPVRIVHENRLQPWVSSPAELSTLITSAPRSASQLPRSSRPAPVRRL
jgi:hypothetical protein